MSKLQPQDRMVSPPSRMAWALACLLVAPLWLVPAADAAPEIWVPGLPKKGLSLDLMRVEAFGRAKPYVRWTMRPIHKVDREKRKLVLSPWAAKLSSKDCEIVYQAALGLHTLWGTKYNDYSRHPKVQMTFAPTKPGERACPQERGVRGGIPHFSPSWFFGVANVETEAGLINLINPVAGARAAPAGLHGDTDAMQVLREAIKHEDVLGAYAKEMIVDAVTYGTAGRTTREFLDKNRITPRRNETLRDTFERVLAASKDESKGARPVAVQDWEHLQRIFTRNGTFWEFGRFFLDRDHGRFIRDRLFAPMIYSGIALGVHEGRAPLEDDYWMNYTTAKARARYFSGLAGYVNAALVLHLPYYDTEFADLVRDVAFQIAKASTKLEHVGRLLPSEDPGTVAKVIEFTEQQVYDMTLGRTISLNADQRRLLEAAGLGDLVGNQFSLKKQPWLPRLTLPEEYHKPLIIPPE